MKHLVYFTATDHAVYSWKAGRLELLARFGGDEAGLAGFREFLGSRGGALFYAVADLAGEDFHEEQIPYLRGNDREQVVQRRLAQRYRDTRLATALSLGAVKGERRNERLLLTSFTNTQQLAPWLDALGEAGAKLAGVYSVPLLAPALAARLGVRGGRAMVVTADAAGLRQCYVEDGRLRFARLERTVDMVPEVFAALVRTETGRLAQYLSTLRVLPREGAPVHVVVVAPPGQREAFERALVSDARLSFVTLDLAEATRKAGVKGAPAGMGAEQLYLHLAVTRAPREQFARREDRRSFHLWQLQRGLVERGSQSPGRLFETAALTTRSITGLKEYLTAEQLLRSGPERIDSAIAGFQHAVQEDSTFSLAHYRLAVASGWQGRQEMAGAATAAALRHSDRLAERDRRLLQAYDRYRRGDVIEAEQEFRALVRDYPDDLEAEFQLADLLVNYSPLQGRSQAEARDLFDRILAYDPGFL